MTSFSFDDFSLNAKDAIAMQAIDHVFFAHNFEKNVKNVKAFEKKMGCKYLHPYNVILMINEHGANNHYFPVIYKNVLEYVKYARDEFSSMQGIDLKKENERINQILDLNRIYSKSFETLVTGKYFHFYHYGLIDYLNSGNLYACKAFVGKKPLMQVFEEEVCALIANNFLYTKEIIENTEEAISTCSLDIQFLRYVKFLSEVHPELLLNQDFCDHVWSILLLNKSIFLERKNPRILTNQFLSTNLKTMEIVRKMTKKELE